MGSRGGVDCTVAGVEQRIEFEEGDGVCRDVEGGGMRFRELCVGAVEDAEEAGFVGGVGGGGHIGASDVAGTAMDDDPGRYGGFDGVLHVGGI